MAYVIGVDVGSQSVKATLLDEDGAVLADAVAACETAYPRGGWAEQDPGDWERGISETVRQLLADAGIGGGEVAMLALASQVDGLVAIDKHLRPLRPAIIWLDRRATREAALLARTASGALLTSRTGLIPDASHTAPKAMWLRDHEPQHYNDVRWLASVGAYLNCWLTGEVVHDHAHASSTLLYDLATRDWCPELVRCSQLDPAMLPPIRPAGEVVGPLTPGAAEALGLSTECHVAVGTGDDHGAALGAGAVQPGVVVDVTGTAEVVAVAALEPVIDEERLLETHAHAVEHLLLVENPGFVSGGSTRWWADTRGLSQSDLFTLASLAPPGSDGALFLPTMSGATAPRWNDRMRGCFAGLGLHHDAAHLVRAILEGCAFALRDIIDRLAELGLAGEEILVVGGGSRSPLWLQIKADVTGRPVRAIRAQCAAATGAAMLAGVAAGYFADLDEAVERAVHPAEEPVLPRRATANVYADAYDSYRRLFDGVEGALA